MDGTDEKDWQKKTPKLNNRHGNSEAKQLERSTNVSGKERAMSETRRVRKKVK